jgi:hypothetical protein
MTYGLKSYFGVGLLYVIALTLAGASLWHW